MEEQIETCVSPQQVWAMWEKAMHQNQGKLRYQILEVKEGEGFSILWKSLFVRLVFSHMVKPNHRGAIISYRAQFRGPFAWLLKWLLGEKVKKNMAHVLKSVVKELENQRVE